MLTFGVIFQHKHRVYNDQIQSSSNDPNLYFSFHIWWRPCGICLSVSGLFHLMYCPLFPFIFLQMTLCLLYSWIIFIVYIYHIFFILGWFCIFVIMNSTTITVGMQVSFWCADFISLEIHLRVGMLDHFLRTFHVVLHNSCTNFHSHQQCIGLLFSTSSRICYFGGFWCFFNIIVTLTGWIRWYLTVLLIYIALVAC
jgi:hypothetical protein